MQSKIAKGSRRRRERLFYYRCGGRYSRNGFATCDHAKRHRAEEVEAQVWRYVRVLLEDPEQLRDDLEGMIELEQEGTWENPQQDKKVWLNKLSEVGCQRSRAQDLPVQGLLDYDELRTKLANLEEIRKAAERELAALEDHQQRLAKLEQNKEAVLEYYSKMAPEALHSLTPQERQHLYGMLHLRALQYPDGKVEAELDGAPRPSASAMENTRSSICSSATFAGLHSYARLDASTG